ncbi:Rieske (2Fe-2S) protein [Solimicrobium silvestre]|uniref:Ferredoxin subunit of nitrite reductase and ring-hydroxylating dioxygenase n=1 Tax=Solimicrobium silvestre TaxID=2099400 RepID=A0A2S9GWY9_9BURK|nr:Rieske 2Fe-2S domain-containing protein [Solimicrobium silvestre]PRC92235.1 Ferredoxin subunit of nitrite reductase and ring-hydroxylating dioxygenase [Solimicrobium silvestre]
MTEIWVCASEDVHEGGKGIRFPVTAGNDDSTGFVVRYSGVVHGYLNRCAHVPIELDWSPGEFFEGSGLYLMCSTHGAIYEPDTGHCSGGPCKGGRLRVIKVSEKEGKVFWHPDEFVKPVRA